MTAGAVASARFDLVPLSPPFLEPLLAGRRDAAGSVLGVTLPDGWPDEHDARFLRLRLGELRREPVRAQWLVRGVVAREPERELVGHAGFHGPPGVNGPGKAGALEIGYTIFEPYRGRGYATEAAAALVDWAAAEHGVRDFIASVAPDNAPSLAVLRKLGFLPTGEQWDDEDGLELVFELRR